MNNATGAAQPHATPQVAAGDRVISTAPDSTAGRVGTVRSVEQHPARYDDDGAVAVPTRTVVVVDLDCSTTGTAFIADGDEPLHLVRTVPEIECAAWCDDGDGHPDQMHADDHVCQSEEMIVRPLARVSGGPMSTRFETYAVVARRDPGKAPSVVLWEIEACKEQSFSVVEARTLAAALLSAACMAEDVTLDPVAVVNVGVFR